MIDIAALALLVGVADPLAFLNHDLGEDWLAASAIVQRANELYLERRKVEFEALSKMIGNEVGKAMGG